MILSFRDVAVIDDFEINMKKCAYIVNRSYLPLLDDKRKCSPVPFNEYISTKKIVKSSSCFFPIKKIVYDKEEDNLQKLVNVYSGAYALGINLAMIIKSDANGIEIYLGACDEAGERENGAGAKAEILYNNFMGNFPGSRESIDDDTPVLDIEQTEDMMKRCFPKEYGNIASISGISSLRGVKIGENKNESFFQGIEKVIEAMNGRNYTLLILAKTLSNRELAGIHDELCSVYSVLSPFAKTTASISQGNSNSITNSLANSISASFTMSASNSLNVGISRSTSAGKNVHSNYNAGMAFPIVNLINAGISKGEGTYESNTQSGNLNRGASFNKGSTTGATTTHSSGQTSTETFGQSLQLIQENKKITDILADIDLQLKRLKSGAGLGMFATAAYVLTMSSLDAKLCAGSYKAAISGDNTHVEEASVNIWQGEAAKHIRAYLEHFQHPIFSLQEFISPNASMSNLVTTSPASIVSAPELTLYMNLPKKSVNKISVCQGVSFGRNVIFLNAKNKALHNFELGNIYHLGLKDSAKAQLDIDSLTMHTFITGTTGSGKSNTVYGLLQNIQRERKNVKFLVIEPAKGEYKTVFGCRGDTFVYGVNPQMTPLFRINPFRFRRNIHILEHLDRLVSIFNVCWPMEAAMPSILKQGVERAYEALGWDLKTSTNKYSGSLFPDFNDVMHEVESILNESAYSDENRGNYIGALCTRLRELTTGLNSMLFVPDDLTDEELFEENVIVDLSRLGSAETKSLIMGLMVIRLQEYRQCTQNSLKTPLSHITVLEEAHHLLKRTSTEQSINSANMAGKAVEMLTNAFAEMRSAGEGFIIADQAPGLMDMAVIRNTNTKIVMRLPAHEDRELVGKAMGLNDLQILELSKLPTGVAAIYQNDWLFPVLVQIPYYKTTESIFQYEPDDIYVASDDSELLLSAIMRKNGIKNLLEELGGAEGISCLRLPSKVKLRLIDYANSKDELKLDKLSKIAFEFFNMREVVKSVSRESLERWKDEVIRKLQPPLDDYEQREQETLLILLSREYAKLFREFEPIYVSLTQNIK